MKYTWIILIFVVGGAIVLWAKKAPPQAAVIQQEAPAQSEKSEQKQAPLTSTKRVQNGMTIETIKEGNGPAITNGQTAVVQYEGKLTDGSVFDATAKHGGKAFEFPLGAGMVIKGWDQGVLGMKVGETRILTIPPELGYGAAGYPPVIPQNATLIFTVTLEGVK